MGIGGNVNRAVEAAAHPPLRGDQASELIAGALADFAAGRPIVIVDPPVGPAGHPPTYPGYNEGYVVVAAEHCTAEIVTFMATHARGLICVCLTADRCEELDLRPMTQRNENPSGADYQVSVEAREGISTGISAADRALTVAVAIDPERGAADLVRPGHIFPLRGRPGGVLERAGQCEASIDLARMAGLTPAGVICGIMNDSGAMATPRELEQYCEEHELRLVSVADIVSHRLSSERRVTRSAATEVTVRGSACTAVAYRDEPAGVAHVALAKGLSPEAEDVLVAVNRSCVLGDVFGADGHAGPERLAPALDALAREPHAVVIHLAVTHGALSGPFDCAAVDYAHEATAVTGILKDLGVASMRILTDRDEDAAALSAAGIPAQAVRPEQPRSRP
jgi:3,4-dihydroxy 2-butanone 4-phosphate synthase/GTP cyclohydrolase II